MKFILLVFLFFGLSCAIATRKPSSVDSGVIREDLKSALATVQGASYNKETCAMVLQNLQQNLRSIDWNFYTNEDLKRNALDIMNLSWQLRLGIHQKLGGVDQECVLQARDIFHTLRDVEDYLGDFAYSSPNLVPSDFEFQKQAVPIYDRQAYPPYFVRADLDTPKFDFQAGDLMLARGISFTSAIITQISDNRSHFSHVVFVDKIAKNQTAGTIESYIGSGVKHYEMNFALKNENVRLLVLRPKDAILGQRATVFANKAAASHVPYDYAMDFKDYSALSCVELSIYAYDKASNGTLKLPLYPAQLTLNNTDFLNKMELKKGPLITPDDLETDPNFDLVLDWKDYRLVRDSRHKDAILSEMMRWMNDLHYNFHWTVKSIIAEDVVKPLRYTPLWPLLRTLPGDVVPNIDKEVPRETLGVMKVLDQVGNYLLQELRKQDNVYTLQHHRPMTNEQLRVALENIRRSGLKSFDNAFHP
ncbi:MAG: hypothetical protein ACXVB4_14380 [Pseudobdellovibrionaceae bacterium]